MKTNWKLTVHEGHVVVVKESDLPLPFDPDKALRVTNVIGAFGCADGNPDLEYGIGENVENGFFTIRMGENQLYDIPEGWEVNVDKSNRCTICGATVDQPCADKSGETKMLESCNCDMDTATLVRSAPVEAPAVEKQEDLWREVASMVWGKTMVDSALQTKEFQIIKSKYTLTRKP